MLSIIEWILVFWFTKDIFCIIVLCIPSIRNGWVLACRFWKSHNLQLTCEIFQKIVVHWLVGYTNLFYFNLVNQTVTKSMILFFKKYFVFRMHSMMRIQQLGKNVRGDNLISVSSSIEGCQPDVKYKIQRNSLRQSRNQLKFWE